MRQTRSSPIRITLALTAGLVAAGGALGLALGFAPALARGLTTLTASVGLDRSAPWHIVVELIFQMAVLALPAGLAYGTVMAAGAGRRLRLGRLLVLVLGMLLLCIVILALFAVLHLLGALPVLTIAAAYIWLGFTLGDWVITKRAVT